MTPKQAEALDFLKQYAKDGVVDTCYVSRLHGKTINSLYRAEMLIDTKGGARIADPREAPSKAYDAPKGAVSTSPMRKLRERRFRIVGGRRVPWSAVALVAVALWGCSSAHVPPGEDAGALPPLADGAAEPDAGPEDAGDDAGVRGDAGHDASALGDAGSPPEITMPVCEETQAAVETDGHRFPEDCLYPWNEWAVHTCESRGCTGCLWWEGDDARTNLLCPGDA